MDNFDSVLERIDERKTDRMLRELRKTCSELQVKDIRLMPRLIAKNTEQLGIALKLLYACGVGFRVQLEETDEKKILYIVRLEVVPHEVFEAVRDEYHILIS